MGLNDQSVIKSILITIASVSVAICGSFYLSRRHIYYKEFKRLQILREKKILQKYEDLRKLSAVLNEKDMTDTFVSDILDKSIEDLLKFVGKDENALDYVLAAYQKKALEVHSKLNCVVDFVHIDKSEINVKGPLYGLPVSIKDNFLINGYQSCAGCSYFLDKEVKSNSVLVDVIKDLGAVPFVKTIVPQTMMSILSSNPIDGVALNPANDKMSPGGSSSGEGSLIGARGSIVGLGTDIGGSVRLPAAFCGIVGFKPTVGRLSKKGLLEMTRFSMVTGACGILGRDVTTVSCLFRHIVNSALHRKLDPMVVPMDFKSEIYDSKKKLKIGYFVFDGSYRAVPAIERAVLKTVKLLIRNGHELVPWQPPANGEKWLTLFLSAITVDKGKDITRICRYDKLDSSVMHLLDVLNWNTFQYFYKLTMCKLFGYNDLNVWVNASRSLKTSAEVMQLMLDIKSLRQSFITDMIQHNVDAIICPTSGFVALPVKPKGSITGMLTYQNIWNLIDFPAGTVPVTKVTHSDISDLQNKYPRTTSMWHENTFTNQTDSLYLPVSVQCVTKPWQEEICLRIMKEIEDNLSIVE